MQLAKLHTKMPWYAFVACLCVCRSCLEVGCGSGYVICSVALAIQQLEQLLQQQQQQLLQHNAVPPGAAATAAAAAGHGDCCQFFATDINPAALQAASQTLAAHKVRYVLSLNPPM
jgi:methylase of polypeptide subunit release factors